MPANRFAAARLVVCPPHEARRHLSTYLCNADLSRAFEVRLRVGVDASPRRASADTPREEDLVFSGRPQTQHGDRDLLFDASWTSPHESALPAFFGELLVRQDDRHHTLLVIGGRYEPTPGSQRVGLQGAREASVVSESANDLLERMRYGIEAALAGARERRTPGLARA